LVSAAPRGHILVGDARERLAELPDASVDCVITSPPYFALRDYGHDDQIGAEAHVERWVDDLVEVCNELRRVLVPHGSLWLDLGDGFARHPREGAKKKSLLLGPERVALRLTDGGWLLRNKVIWAKTNPMPASVTDRLSCTHEVIYFLTKQPRYYFDLHAIREPASTPASRGRPARSTYPPPSAVPFVGRVPRVDLNHGLDALKAVGRQSHPLGKNPGDVWSIATASYRGAHFASFPVELVRRPLLATCPEQACTSCGQPWRRAVQAINGRKLATGSLRAGCNCRAPSRPGIVLDAFLGAGTTALAAEQHGRDWIGIELNPDYAALAEKRLADWRHRQSA
jgi:DNA modification methylase